jgi:hypothetical protein
VGVAHIYFNYKEHGSQGLSSTLGSLIKQLCQQLPRLYKFPPQLESLTKDERTPSEEVLFLALIEASKSFSKSFLVFGALDKCNRKIQRETLLPKIHHLSRHGICIFITSLRYPDDLEEKFRNVPDIEIVAHDDDIKRYTYARLNAYPSVKVAVLEDEVVLSLIRAAGGM